MECFDLGMRIKEIMEDKGDAFSLRAIHKRAGYSSFMKMHRALKGEDYKIVPHLEKIADALKVNVERIKMTDTAAKRHELHTLLKSGTDPQGALKLALEISEVALGVTERFYTLCDLGKANQAVGDFENALAAWGAAKEVAKNASNDEWLYEACNHLCHAYFANKQFKALADLLETEMAHFAKTPNRLGRFTQFLSFAERKLGNEERADKLLQESYGFFLQTNDRLAVGRTEMNIALSFFEKGCYFEAREWYENAKNNLADDTIEIQGTIAKDFARVLIVLGDTTNASIVIDNELKKMSGVKNQYPDIYGKLLLLKAILTSDHQFAEDIFSLGKLSSELTASAADFLVNFYLKHNDSIGALKYYNIVKGNPLYGVPELEKWRGF